MTDFGSLFDDVVDLDVQKQQAEMIDTLSDRLEAFIEFASREIVGTTSKVIIESQCLKCAEHQFYIEGERVCHYCSGTSIKTHNL